MQSGFWRRVLAAPAGPVAAAVWPAVLDVPGAPAAAVLPACPAVRQCPPVPDAGRPLLVRARPVLPLSCGQLPAAAHGTAGQTLAAGGRLCSAGLRQVDLVSGDLCDPGRVPAQLEELERAAVQPLPGIGVRSGRRGPAGRAGTVLAGR